MSSKALVQSNESSVVEGDILVFDCKAVGCPTPAIEWQFSDTGITSSFRLLHSSIDVQMESYAMNSVTRMSRLTITNSNLLQTGFYRCCSSNSAVPNTRVYSVKETIVYCKKAKFCVMVDVQFILHGVFNRCVILYCFFKCYGQ